MGGARKVLQVGEEHVDNKMLEKWINRLVERYISYKSKRCASLGLPNMQDALPLVHVVQNLLL